DTLVPVQEARSFAAALRRAAKSSGTGPVVYAELPGGQHSFDLFHSFRYEAVIDGIEAFAAGTLDRAQGAGTERSGYAAAAELHQYDDHA
ncbi:MAG: hypothetical protein M3Y45_04695, partial [Actinomycetota bacterium]|nr:hypothetical protein [Actinomycetota bacterium]